MATISPHVSVGPLPLHQSQLEAAAATAREMERDHPMVPHVSRAWALRELATWGVVELERAVDDTAALVLRAPSPPRGRATKSRADRASAGAFTVIAPLLLPRALVARLRDAIPRIARATGTTPTLSAVLREAILLGHEARERHRVELEARATEVRAVLARAGMPATPEIVHVSVRLIAPYAAPGPSPTGQGTSSDWSPVRLVPRGGTSVETTVHSPGATRESGTQASSPEGRSRSRTRRRRDRDGSGANR